MIACIVCKIVIVYLLMACARSVIADTLNRRVIGFIHGDTLTVLEPRFEQLRNLLVDIAAPESEQPFGTCSQRHLRALTFGQSVTDRRLRRAGLL